MKLFAKEESIQYWIILFMESDPLLEPITSNPEFKKYLEECKSRFWKKHDELKLVLEKEGVL
jgi:hypothetical protein